jgi:hypothetical protein
MSRETFAKSNDAYSYLAVRLTKTQPSDRMQPRRNCHGAAATRSCCREQLVRRLSHRRGCTNIRLHHKRTDRQSEPAGPLLRSELQEILQLQESALVQRRPPNRRSPGIAERGNQLRPR